MRVITLYQPIASLLWEGIKTVESRGWPTNVRGELYIHSAKAFPSDAWIDKYVNDPVFRFYALGGHRHTFAMALAEFRGNLDRFPRGVIGGKVDVVDCLTPVIARERLGALAWRREKALGDLGDASRFAWLTRDPVRLDRPIPAAGSQGFWSHPEISDIVPSINYGKP